MKPTTSVGPHASSRRPNRFLRITVWSLLIMIVVAVLATFGISYYVGYKLTHWTRAAITKSPKDVGLPFTDITFPARTDGLEMKGWLIPPSATTNKIVILAHGFRGNRVKDDPALPTMKALHDQGYAVLTFDFRHEGESPGSMVSVGYFEQRDLLGAVDYAKKLGYKKIGLLGFSMGASTSLEVAAEDNDVNAVIADSPFANLHDYLVGAMPQWSHLPNWPFTPEMLWEIKTFDGLDASQVDPLGDLQHWTPKPLLLIAGTADTLIPMSNSQELYNAVKGNSNDQLWIVPGAKHVGAYDVVPDQYEAKVTAFFNQYLK